MELNEVNVAALAANRKPISIIGSCLGTSYFQAQTRSCFPEFEKQKMLVEQGNNVELILNRAPRRYRLTSNDITSVEYTTDAVGAPVVILNKDQDCEVKLPVSTDLTTVGTVTQDALKKALSGDKTVIFSNAKKVCNELNSFNDDEVKRIDAVIEQLNRMRQTIKSTIAENNKKAEQYERELLDSTPKGYVPDSGAVLNPQTVVNVHVED